MAVSTQLAMSRASLRLLRAVFSLYVWISRCSALALAASYC
jgi:hypothetical protein